MPSKRLFQRIFITGQWARITKLWWSQMTSIKRSYYAFAALVITVIVTGCQSTYESLEDKPLQLSEQGNVIQINVNQVGYFVTGSKIAYISGAQAEGEVKLVDYQTGRVVEQLTMAQHANQNPDLPNIWKVDFSHIKATGKYVLMKGKVRSPVFEIGSAIYQSTITKLLRSYYLQRCGEPIKDPVAKVSHKICHTKDSQLFRKLKGIEFPASSNLSTPIEIDTTGGWHDAGDFGKYVTTTAVSIGRVLSAFLSTDDFLRQLDLTLPDHQDSMPDVLTEMKHGLSWLLKMQHHTGMVFRKVGAKKWPSLGAPEKDRQQRYVYGVATDDTAKFASVMALAARIYQEYDVQLAEQYQQAAELAWQYLAEHPSFFIDWQKRDDTGSGPYIANATDKENSLTHDRDDRFWAAAELYLATKENQYLTYINQHIDLPLNLFEWKDPAALGKWHLYEQLCNRHSYGFCSYLKQQFIARATTALERAKASDYAVANNRFIWGSNKMAAEEGMFLLIGYYLTHNQEYVDAAIYQADYLLGANPFGLSYVSGVGEQPVQNVSHIFTRGENIYIPGLFVGGPNVFAQANVAPKNKGILSYVDNAKSYAVNEYAIDYNASLIGLLIELDKLNIRE
ncbi:glycosyl hydrolase family 5 [Thalassotalea euphylliae]|uniref:Endoglucanase n=2 Tax=Thalassotalea euphylliae TaxID=1655234 RepID=A0A3E0TMS3_9GAMM|nr:glycosyl hydrolase family 5 [Thalassotalea euphylliae]